MADKLSGSRRDLLVREFLRELETAFEAMVADFGGILSNFNLAHWKVLMSVWERSGKITQTEAKKIISSIPNFQSDNSQRSLVKELALSGMITKTLDPRDERRVILSVTDEALPKIERYMRRVENAIQAYSRKLKD